MDRTLEFEGRLEAIQGGRGWRGLVELWRALRCALVFLGIGVLRIFIGLYGIKF